MDILEEGVAADKRREYNMKFFDIDNIPNIVSTRNKIKQMPITPNTTNKIKKHVKCFYCDCIVTKKSLSAHKLGLKHKRMVEIFTRSRFQC